VRPLRTAFSDETDPADDVAVGLGTVLVGVVVLPM